MSKKKEEDLASVLADELNKLSKDQNVAFFLDSDEAPTNVGGWVSSGCSMLDVAVSNRAYGGFPVGRITEITGLEQCVTEDTIIDVIIDDNEYEKQISEVKSLLTEGKKIKVKTLNDEYVNIVDYFEKGVLPTYEVSLGSGYVTKTSKSHRFFTTQGWVETKDLKPSISSILCDDNEYRVVEYVNYIGEYPIVDIEVDSEEHSYFTNGMLSHNSGKSLLSSHLLAETQKQDGVAVMIDTETAVSREFLEAIGVDVSKLLYVTADSVEQIFEYIETIIEKVRNTEKDRLVTIVVDSVAAASTKAEIASDYDKDGYATDKAIIISKAMRKITNMIGREKITLILTNQLRQKMGVMFGDPWCVDPYSTKVKIRYKLIEQEITLAELSSRFLGNSNFKDERVFDLSNGDIEVLTLDADGNEVYKPILSYLVKPSVSSYYTDGDIKVTANHRILEKGQEIFAKNHPEFSKVDEPMDVVDIEVADLHTYLANGRLNHNTTSGGKSIAFHSSVRLRLKNMGKLKQKINGEDKIIGMKVRCQVIKNRMGPPLRSADFDIFFDRGIDDYGSWLSVMKTNKLVKRSGAWYTYEETDLETGEITNEYKFQSKDFIELMETNEELRKKIYEEICDATILQYKSDTTDLESVEIEVEE